MNILKKASILGSAGKFDSCGPRQCEIKVSNSLNGLYQSESENKNCVMLKTLMTNKCVFDCGFCSNSSRSKPFSSVSFSPDELLRVFLDARKNLGVNGLFLSSSISGNPDGVMEDIISAASLVRTRFGGYIHLKVMPGASFDFVKRACEVANRVSINLESPSSSSLRDVSDCKDFKVDILRRQSWIKRFSRSQSTQMVVRSDDSDLSVLKMSNWEYNNMGLKRVYYSAFSPVRGTFFENKDAVSLRRQNSLYKADFLLREYGFKFEEIKSVLDNDMLPFEDVKVALAKNYFSNHIDVNDASSSELLRVPGIGLVSSARVFASRGRISSFSDLKRLGVNIKRAAPFIKIEGSKQLTLNSF